MAILLSFDVPNPAMLLILIGNVLFHVVTCESIPLFASMILVFTTY